MRIAILEKSLKKQQQFLYRIQVPTDAFNAHLQHHHGHSKMRFNQNLKKIQHDVMNALHNIISKSEKNESADCRF